MSTGFKMVAAAIVASALTAALFLTFGPDARPAAPPPPSPAVPAPATLAPGPDLAAELDFEPISGAGVISGRAALEDGTPVKGVVVVATPLIYPEPPYPQVSFTEQDLEEAVREAAEAARLRMTGTRRATTGTDGSYRLSELGDVPYRLNPSKESCSIRAAKGQSSGRVQPDDTVDFVVKPIVRVRFLVEGANDRDEEPVCVAWRPTREDVTRAGGYRLDPDDPVLDLAPGTVWVMAYQGRNRERKSEPVELTLAAGAPETTVVLRLNEEPGLRGRVIIDEALDVSRVDVHALPFAGETPPNVHDHAHRGTRARYDRRDGRYSFPKLAPGHYYVWVTFGGNEVMGSAVVDVTDRLVEQDIEAGVPDPEGYLVARILDPDGQPVDPRRTRVTLQYRGGGLRFGGPAEAIARRDGTWLINPEPGTDLPKHQRGGKTTILVSHSEFGRLVRPIEPGQGRGLELRFAKPTDITVKISGLAQTDLVGRVGLYLKKELETDGLSLSGAGARSSGEEFVLKRVQSGDYLLTMICEEQGHIIVDRLPINVTESTKTIDWPLPPLYTVRLTPADPEKRLWFRLVRRDPAGDWMHQVGRKRDGKPPVLPYVPPGTYELIGNYGDEQRVIPLNVPAQTEIRVE